MKWKSLYGLRNGRLNFEGDGVNVGGWVVGVYNID